MQAVAAAPGLCYSPGSYPYFFKDTDGNKTCSADRGGVHQRVRGLDGAA